VRKAVYDLCDGWTFLGYVEGAYRMADRTQSLDRSAVYMVVLDEDRVGDLERILLDFKSKTLQEAIYLEVQHGVDFRFLRAEEG